MEREPLINRLQKPLALASAVGFVLSLAAHVHYRLQPNPEFDTSFLPLFFGVFVVWFPTVFSLQRFQRERFARKTHH